MANKTKQALRVDNNQSFPNNNSGFITPEKLRTFQEDIIDSFVNNADSSSLSFNSGSLLTTASATGATIEFTKGDGSTFDVTVTVEATNTGSLLQTASFNEYTQSTDNRLTNIELETASLDGRVSSIETFTSSVDTKFDTLASTTSSLNTFTSSQETKNSTLETFTQSLYQTASNDFSEITLTKVDGTTQVLDTTPRQIVESVKNGNGQTLVKGTPVFASGSVGNSNLVFPASASNASTMPAVYILAQELAPDEEGLGLTHGFINGVDTSLFTAGDEIFVGENGGYTNQRPTGSNLIQKLGVVVRSDDNNGSGVIQIDGVEKLPNIQEGYAWVGDTNGVPQQVTTGSIAEHLLTQNNSFTGLQTFNDIAVNGTASFEYIESVTGSAKIIGDAFIVLNNNTPAERYAGLVVVDSGSENTTASLQFDGQTNDWFYEYTGSDPLNHGIVLFGPEYGTKGSPIYPTNNRIQKGDGGHHLVDTNITDDGSTVSINSNTEITGSLLVNGNTPLINTDLTSLNSFTASQEDLNGTFATTGSNTFTGQQDIVSSSLTITEGGITLDADNIGTANLSTNNGQVAFINTAGFRGFRAVVDNGFEIATAANGFFGLNPSFTAGASFFMNSNDTLAQNVFDIGGSRDGRYVDTGFSMDLNTLTNSGWSGSGWFAYHNDTSNYYDVFHLQDNTNYTNGDITFKVPVVVDNTFTASLTEGHILVGDSNDTTTEIPTGSFATTGSNTFTDTQTISGSTTYEVVNNTIVSQTSSIDFSATSIQTITLVSGSTTHLLPTNVDKGQTTNLLIKQPSVGTGSIEFSLNFLQATGSEYTPTPSEDAEDILTFITFDDDTKIYVSNITEFV